MSSGENEEELPIEESATEEAVAEESEAEDSATEVAADQPAATLSPAETATSVESVGKSLPAEPPVLGEHDLTDEQNAFPWFVVQTYSGFEMRVKLSLEERIRSTGVAHKFGRILVPQETVEEMVRGAKRTSKKKFFPGYILVQVDLDDDTWHMVKDTPKVSGFIGDSRRPSPLSEQEVTSLLAQMEGGAKRPRPRKQFEEGDAVKVIDGPFAEFNGTVDDVKPDKGKLRVLISIFGRNTPVELDFAQVEKV